MNYGQALETKLVNALVGDAEVVWPVGIFTWPVLNWFHSYYKGLWVGGRADLTQTHFVFAPNAMNKAVHEGDTSFAFPLDVISGVTIESGFVTNIIAIATPGRVYRVRCFGAEKFADSIMRRKAAAHT